MLRVTRQTTGIDIRFIRAGGSLPENIEAFPIFPVESNCGKNAGHLVIYGLSEPEVHVSDREIEAFAASLANLLGDAYRWQWALRQREADQASDIPITCRVRHEDEFADLLREQLKHAARLVRCQAAALYMLNKDSTLLKLRAAWGLPEEKLLDPPRALRESLADMESMLGQAVIVNDEFLLETWNPPESFPTSVCVPVASETLVYGTLWFFSCNEKDFTTEELAVLEISAGRIAVEIEKSALVKEIKYLRG